MADANRHQTLVDSAVAAALLQFETNGLASNQLALTVVNLREAGFATDAGYRGDAQIYPASAVNLLDPRQPSRNVLTTHATACAGDGDRRRAAGHARTIRANDESAHM